MVSMRGIKDKLHDLRMHGFRKRLARQEEERHLATRREMEKREQSCETAANKTLGLCKSLVRGAALTDIEASALADGLESKFVSSRAKSKRDEINWNLAGKVFLRMCQRRTRC